MKRCYFDWSGGGIHVIDDDTNNGQLPNSGKDDKAFDDVRFYSDFDEFFDSLTEPTELIGETTFESFVLEKRKAVLEKAKQLGHTFRCTPNRKTGRRRRMLGYSDSDKSDYLDVYVIRDIANDGKTHLKVPKIYGDDIISTRKQASRELVLLRNTKIRVPSRAKRGYVIKSKKDVYAQLLIKQLPPYRILDPYIRIALGNGSEYSKTVVAAVGIAAKYASNRETFERICGLYEHGYPSIHRSDLMMHRWSRGLRPEGKGKNAGKISISQFRKALRWLYQRIKVVGITDPATRAGSSHPTQTADIDAGSPDPATRAGRRHPASISSQFFG
jgi:hypothetical protein